MKPSIKYTALLALDIIFGLGLIWAGVGFGTLMPTWAIFPWIITCLVIIVVCIIWGSHLSDLLEYYRRYQGEDVAPKKGTKQGAYDEEKTHIR